MYNWLEVEFDPLTLCNKAKVVIDALEEDRGDYTFFLIYQISCEPFLNDQLFQLYRNT